jgi:hypothetical protein
LSHHSSDRIAETVDQILNGDRLTRVKAAFVDDVGPSRGMHIHRRDDSAWLKKLEFDIKTLDNVHPRPPRCY